MVQRKALITGITGQDGSYLAELLLQKGYLVYGIIRRSSSFNTGRIDSIYQDPHTEGAQLKLFYGDMTDGAALEQTVRAVMPDEIYNLASQSHVRVSFDIAEYTSNVTAGGALRLLEIVRQLKKEGHEARYYQASSSEMFGNAPAPQNEDTMFFPQSPYACAKVYAHHLTDNYREAYGLYACSGILFNHESPRRGETFVSKKITMAVARIKKGLENRLWLGNLDAQRDWGYAPEYVKAMWMMLQQKKPKDFVIATGETHTVRDFMVEAFECVGLDWKDHVRLDGRYFRPSEVHILQGDASRAEAAFGWKAKVKFKELVRLMVDYDLCHTRLH